MFQHFLRSAILLPLFLAGTFCLAGNTVQIRVSDQASFDGLNKSVLDALDSDAPSVEVLLDSGTYYYQDRHLELKGVAKEGKRLSIRGNGAVLYPALADARGDDFDVDAAYYADSAGFLKPVYAPEPMKRAGFLVRIVSRRERICRLRIDEELGEYAVRNGYVYLTEWFRGRIYKITAVKGRYIYFHADDLAQARLLFNVNLDFTFSLDWPRYRLINCREPSDPGMLKISTASTFLAVSGFRMDSLSVTGLRFVGNRRDAGAEVSALIHIDSTRVSTSIRDCRFEHIRNDCVHIRNSSFVTVADCSFDHCYRFCVYATKGVSDIVIADNQAHMAGLCGDNCFVFRCCADRFRISGNVISDYGYGAVSTGIHYSVVKTEPVRGSIIGNEIFQSPGYFAQAPLNLLMDSGAIYVATQNDSVLISENYIHDINGPTYNRGIFADDGASHLTITRNRVERVENYFAIDIDPRSAWKMRWRRNRKVPNSQICVGNRLYDNVVSGRVRLTNIEDPQSP